MDNNSSTNLSDIGLNNTIATLTDVGPNAFVGDMFLIVAVLGGFGNGFVLFVYFRSSKLTDTTMKLIMNLALTDLITAVSLGMNFFGVRFRLVGISYISCLVFMIIPNYMFFVSQSVLAINTFDRYIAICHYEQYTRIMTKTALRLMLAAAWFCPLILLSIPFFGFNYWAEIKICRYRSLLHEWVYITNSTVIIFLMAISAFFYVLILKKAWEFYRRFLPAQTQKSDDAEKERIRAKKRAIKNGKAMGVVTLVFAICWLPSNIFQYWFGLTFKGYDILVGIVLFLGTLNCVVNPFVYAWQKKDFRTEAKTILRCGRSTTSEVTNTKKNKTKQVRKRESDPISLPTTSSKSSEFVMKNMSIENDKLGEHVENM